MESVPWWDLFVGRDFLGYAMCSASEKRESLGEAEFKYFRRWMTGTVVGDHQTIMDLMITKKIKNLVPT